MVYTVKSLLTDTSSRLGKTNTCLSLLPLFDFLKTDITLKRALCACPKGARPREGVDCILHPKDLFRPIMQHVPLFGSPTPSFSGFHVISENN